MSIPKNVEAHLKKNNVPFDVVTHKIVYTAYDLAATLREKLEGIGKTLLIRTDTGFVIVVVPANRRIDLVKLKKALGAKKLSIVSEQEMIKTLKVKAGGLTSFGTIHKAGVFMDKAMLKTSKILVAAGSFTDHVRLKAKDFVKLERAKTGNATITVKLPKIAAPKKAKKHKKGTKPKRKPTAKKKKSKPKKRKK